MGCDIHCHVEVKISGEWLLYSRPRVSRNYQLFEKMAGVRGEVENAIAPPRGLPDDISEMTRFIANYDGPDGHSHSWLSATEMVQVEEWLLDHMRQFASTAVFVTPFDYLFGNGFDSPTEYPEDCKRLFAMGYEDVRLVFWFDN